MKRKLPLLLSLALLASIPAVPAAESVSVLLQKGIYAEETEGDLDRAIAIYRDILQEGKNVQPAMAQAHFRLSACYMKQGKNSEAITALRDLLTRYPEQGEWVKRARAHLERLGAPQTSLVVRSVWNGRTDIAGRVSRDGRYLTATDLETGNVALRNLETGTTELLTNKGPWSESGEGCYRAVLSPDGARIAYSWYIPETFEDGRHKDGGYYELRVLTLADRKARTLAGKSYGNTVECRDWSPDGRFLAIATAAAPSGEHTVSLLDLESGEIRVLKPSLAKLPGPMRFSPDGRYLAYSAELDLERPGRDIFVIDLAETKETTLIADPADDTLVDWDREGQSIYFNSDRRGQFGIWSVPILDGVSAGEPRLVHSNIGAMRPMGITQAGTLFYGNLTIVDEIHRIITDPSLTRVLSGPTRIRPQVQEPYHLGRWLMRDVERMLFVRPPNPTTGTGFSNLVTMDLRTGETWPMPSFTRLLFNGVVLPLPDNEFVAIEGHASWQEGTPKTLEVRSLRSGDAIEVARSDKTQTLLWASVSDDDAIYYARENHSTKAYEFVRYDRATGESRTIKILPTSEGKLTFCAPTWQSHRYVFYCFSKPAGNEPTTSMAVRREIETGKTLVLYETAKPIQFFRVGGEGERMAVVLEDEGGRPESIVFLESDADNVRVSGVHKPPPGTVKVEWFLDPDCHKLRVMVKDDNGKDALTRLWLMSPQDGSLTKTPLALGPDQDWIRLHPDGRQYFRTRAKPSMEIRAIDHFLPAL